MPGPTNWASAHRSAGPSDSQNSRIPNGGPRRNLETPVQQPTAIATTVHPHKVRALRQGHRCPTIAACGRSFRAELFAGAPDFPPFEVDGAIAPLSDDRPEHLNEQINGVTFAGIRRFYLIYPEQPGKFPSVAISVPYASHPPETTNATLTLKPRNFTSALPPGAEGLDYFLPTSQLTLRQQWSAPLNHLHVGDAVSRTIVVTAQKMQAMLIPPAKFPAPDGIRVYPKEPSVENTKGPIGEFLAGVRTEQASYLFTKPGDCTIPAVEITWGIKSRKLPD